MYDYNEPVKLVWSNSIKSKVDLGFDATIRYLEAELTACHLTNIPFVKADLEDAKKQNRQTLLEIIVEIIKSHEHIDFELR